MQREGCSSEEVFQFTCPRSSAGSPHEHPRYPDPTDCQYFYICIGGVSARRNGCTVGLVFNPETLSCDRPRNVKGECRTWYNETFLEQHAPTESRRRPTGEGEVVVAAAVTTARAVAAADVVIIIVTVTVSVAAAVVVVAAPAAVVVVAAPAAAVVVAAAPAAVVVVAAPAAAVVVVTAPDAAFSNVVFRYMLGSLQDFFTHVFFPYLRCISIFFQVFKTHVIFLACFCGIASTAR